MIALCVLVLFWVAVGFAFYSLGAKTALTFIGLWVIGLFGAGYLHLDPYLFLAYEAVLAACLCVKLKLEWS